MKGLLAMLVLVSSSSVWAVEFNKLNCTTQDNRKVEINVKKQSYLFNRKPVQIKNIVKRGHTVIVDFETEQSLNTAKPQDVAQMELTAPRGLRLGDVERVIVKRTSFAGILLDQRTINCVFAE